MSKTAKVDVYLNDEQLKARLSELKDEYKQLKILKDKAFEAGDVEGYNKLNSALQKNVNETRKLEKATVDVNSVLKDLSSTSIREIEAAFRQAKREMDNMKRSDPGFDEQKRKVSLLGSELDKAKGKMRENEITARQTYTKIAGYVAAAAAAFYAFVRGISEAVEISDRFGRSVANLSALTGLVGKELKWLSDQAKEIARNGTDAGIKTTQGAQQIVDAYTKIGSARPELLKNKEALNEVTQEAMILAAASDGELQPAVDALAGTLNQFNAPASESRKIINAIAAGSKEGAGDIPYLTKAIEKSGTVASDANISVEELIGTIETLAPRIASAETAGTNLRSVILKLQAGADDTNPAIVGMATALDNLAAKNMSAAQLTTLFGLENVTAAKILINNREELKKYTEAVTGTNVALEQATINTNTDAAAKQRATNRIELQSIALGQKLSPAVTHIKNLYADLLTELTNLVGAFEGSSAASEKSSAAFEKQVKFVTDLNTQMSPLLKRYDELALKAKLSADEQSEMNSMIKTVSETIPGAITQFDKYGNAIAISTSKAREYIAEQVALMAVMNKQAIEDAKKSLKELEDPLAVAKRGLDNVLKTGMISYAIGQSVVTRKASQDEIKEIKDKYATLAQEKLGYETLISELSGDAYKKEAERRETDRKAAEDIENAKVEYHKKTRAELQKLADSGDKLAEEILATKTVVASIEKQITAYDKVSSRIEFLKKKIQDLVALNKPVPNSYIHELAQEEQKLKNIQEYVKSIAGDIARMKPLDSIPNVNVESTRFQGGTTIPSPFSTDMGLAGNGAERNSDTPVANAPQYSKDDINQAAQFALGVTDSTQSAIFDMIKNKQQAALDHKLSMLDKQREAELKNDKLTQDERDKIQEKYRKKAAKMQLDAWKKQKAADVIQGIIKTALAVINQLSGGDPYTAYARAIAAGIAGGAEIAVIAAQKPPEFKEGGYTGDDISDDKPAGITHKNEFVANADATRNPSVKKVLDIIDMAQRSGTIRSINLPAVIEATTYTRQMKAGGYSSIDTGAPVAGQSTAAGSGVATEMAGLMNRMAGTIDRLENRLNSIEQNGIKGNWVLHDFNQIKDKETSAIAATE